MNKKSLLLAFILLAIPILTISSVPRAHAAFFFETWRVEKGKVWVADGILHMQDSYWEGPVRKNWFYHLSLNLETGDGTFRVKWLTTTQGGVPVADGKAARGRITDWFFVSGTYVCHGVGPVEGSKYIGSFEGVMEYDDDGLPAYMGIYETLLKLVNPG